MSHNLPASGSEPAEPLVTVGTITAGVTALLALLVAFAVPISDTQQTAILGVVAVIAPLVVAAVGRRRVYSPATVNRLIHVSRNRL
ncbi:hypothetical protein GCM10027280_45230 [Micromonospora polyrhachis]|uniref:Nitrate/nitrite transporter NarK n=1 Tax=Micromonospora polyrhachis TaxID=1282883 RepID=A0A7W7SQA2_9ACTN|nr:hypothetical protein [Micromonospora polyrhachis]MBB4958963.1 nitrate/nitrite transporter NarK [Micromonospora polyrhachis]